MAITINLYNLPTHEIDMTIEWLEKIKLDCELEISKLKLLKKSRVRSRDYRDNIKDIAKLLYTEDPSIVDDENPNKAISYIRKRMDCSNERAQDIYALLQSKCKKQRRTERDQQIFLLAKIGTKKSDIAKRFGISRQQVYNVLKGID